VCYAARAKRQLLPAARMTGLAARAALFPGAPGGSQRAGSERRPERAAHAQAKLKLMLMRSASTRLAVTSWRSQLSKRMTLPALAG
jgi:hypothetical protein